MMMTKVEENTWDVLTNGCMSAEDVARAFTNFYGMQLITEDFAQFLVDEGYCTDYEIGLDEEEDEEDEEEDEEEDIEL